MMPKHSNRILVGVVILVVVAASIGAYLISSHNATTVTQCIQSGPIGTLRVHLIFDNSTNSSVQGATISGYVSIVCGVEPPPSTTVVRMPIRTVVTPSNGTVTNFEPWEDGTYSLTITYSNRSYKVSAPNNPEQLTSVTLSIPSGNVNIMTTECYPQFMTICGYVS